MEAQIHKAGTASLDTRSLQKLQRNQILDEVVGNWNNRIGKMEGFLDWVKLINEIDDAKLLKITGADAALYLMWLKYCAKFFGVISVINIMFIIMYASGDPLPQDRGNSILQKITLLNVTDAPTKVLLCYLNSMIVIIAMTVYFLVKFKKKYNDQRYGGQGGRNGKDGPYDLHSLSNLELLKDKDMGEKYYSELDISEHGIMLNGLP